MFLVTDCSRDDGMSRQYICDNGCVNDACVGQSVPDDCR
jgi:hypothetical protein